VTFTNDAQRRAAFAKKKPKASKARKTPLDPLRRIDPKGILKTPLARDLARFDSVDLGGWLSHTELGADPLTMLSLAMQHSFLFPDSTEELQQVTHEVTKWAELPWTPDPQQLKAVYLELEAQRVVLEYAVAHASRNLRYIAPQNVSHVVQSALAFMGTTDPVKGQIEDMTRYVERHHSPSFYERRRMDANSEGA
jgi:hypothetical protein